MGLKTSRDGLRASLEGPKAGRGVLGARWEGIDARWEGLRGRYWSLPRGGGRSLSATGPLPKTERMHCYGGPCQPPLTESISIDRNFLNIRTREL